jgi:hypothetical protein
MRRLGGECGEERVEVADQFAELLLVHVERGRDLADAGDQPGEILFLGPGEGLVDDGAAAQGAGGAQVGFVERLRSVHAAHFRFLFCVFGGVRLARDSGAVFDQELLQVGSGVGVERVEHLVELHRIGGLGYRDGVTGGDRRRR